MRVELILEAIDRATAPIRAVKNALRGVNEAASQQLTIDKVNAAKERASAAQASAQSELMGAVAAAAAVAAPITKAVKSWNEYEDILTDVGLKANTAGAPLKALGEEIRAQSRAVNMSSIELMKGLDHMMAGSLDVDVARQITGPLSKATIATKSKFEDLSKSAVSLVNNLKVAPAEVKRALDVMNQAGKDGQFEMKDMARYFPMLGAQYEGMGQKGVKAVADIAAMLQIVRSQTGTAEGAAKALEDLLNKNTLGPAKKKFEELGVDIVKMMEAAQKSGTVMETLHEALQKATGGDVNKIKEIFGDKQALTAARALMQNYEKFLEIRKKALGAQGSVDQDFATRMGLGVEQMRGMSVAGTELATTMGQIFAPTVAAKVQAITNALWQLNTWAKANPELVLALGKIAMAVTGILVAMAALTLVKAVFGSGLMTIIGLLGKFTAAGKNVSILARLFRVLGGAVRLLLLPLALVGKFLLGFAQGAAAAVAAVGGWRVVLLALGSRLMWLVTGPLALLRSAFMMLGAAFMATPFGWVIAAVAAIAAGAYLIYRNWGKIGPWFTSLWEGIKSTFSSAWDAIKAGVASAWQGVLSTLKSSWGSIKSWFASLEWPSLPEFPSLGDILAPVLSGLESGWKKVTALFEGFDPLAKVKEALEPIVKWVTDWGSTVSKAFGTAFEKIGSFLEGVSNKVSAILTGIGDIAGKVGDWFSSGPKVIDPAKMQAGIEKAREYETVIKAIAPAAQQAVNQASSILAAANFHSHGVRMMTTLAQGIKDGSNSAVAAVRDVVQKMRDHLPHSPAKVGPLSDLDRVQFAQTLATAIDRGAPRAVRAAHTLAAGLAAAIPTGTMSTAVSAKPALAQPVGGRDAGSAGKGSSPITVNLSLSPNFKGGDGADFVEQLRAALPDVAYDLGKAIEGETSRRKRTEF